MRPYRHNRARWSNGDNPPPPREMASVHVPDVCTNGSYAEEAPREGFAGYGVWFGPLHPQNISAPVPGPIQTNNRAELTVCIEALRASDTATTSDH